MDKTRLNNWLQFGASVGVILSLIFVGLEIQQSRDIAIADIYQQRTEILLNQLSFGLPPEVVYAALRKARAGEELTEEEEYVVFIGVAARVAYWENNHFQFQLGLMSLEQWEASRKSIALRADNPAFLKAWEEERHTVRKSFADEVDQILSDAASE
jgi:hypothetical protein